MKRLLLMLLAGVSLTLAQEAHITVPYARFTLPNGLTVILHEDHTTPTIAVNALVDVGSSREKPGRTGFAHLFEHLMFMGSPHVPEGMFDQWLESAGGDNNASTGKDYTDYFEDIPANALELPLFLDSDRFGYLVQAMTPEKVDLQRSVVKNEKRQRDDNRPYGMADSILDGNLFPPGHPYHWPVIGSMQDLNAASFQDVLEFFRTYYVPNNIDLVVAGDIDPVKTRILIEKWYEEIPAGAPIPPLTAPPVVITREKRLVYEDRVQLPRLYMAWVTPRQFAPGDAQLDLLASVLSGGKNSRLYKRLVYDMQIAQDVQASQYSQHLASSFTIVATARAGHTLAELETVIEEELNRIKAEPPAPRELQRAVNQYEASFYRGLERVARKASLLNEYLVAAGDPDYFNEDLARYRAADPSDIQNAAQTYLPDNGRVILSVVPLGKKELGTK